MTVCSGYSRFIYPLPGNAGAYTLGIYVLLLGKIIAPASSEINSPYNWDISADIAFIRNKGHNVGYISVKAGHGYSHNWVTYINLEKDEMHNVNDIRPVTFLHNGNYWLGINIRLNNENYISNAVVKTARNLDAEALSVFCYYNNYNGQFIRDEEIYNSIADVPSSWIKGKKFTGRITTDTLAVTGDATMNGNMSIKGDISITGNHPKGTLPVGTVYVQYPDQSEPASIFGGTWSNISSQYAGRFFRAEGGNAVAFGSGQAEGLPYMVHEHTYFAVGRYGMNGTNISTPAWGSGDRAKGSAYAYINTTNYKDVYGSGLYGKSTHVTPENMTIRIWKRIN